MPWRKLYGADYLRTNNVKFPSGDHFFEDNAFHWRALTASKDAKVAYTGTPVVAHTVGDSRQTTAGIDGADAEKLGGYFPNLHAIAAELIEDKAPAFLLREFASFLSRSKWIVSRQQDPKLRAKFARILQRTARDFVDAVALALALNVVGVAVTVLFLVAGPLPRPPAVLSSILVDVSSLASPAAHHLRLAAFVLDKVADVRRRDA